MTINRQELTNELLEEYCARFNNWGRWGDDDELGTLNFITPEKIRESASLVRAGKVFSLELPLDGNGPQTGAFGRVNPVHQMVATGSDHAGRSPGLAGELGRRRRHPVPVPAGWHPVGRPVAHLPTTGRCTTATTPTS